MDVNEVYSLIQFIANKSQQGYIAPSQFNTVINQAQKSYASYLLGSFQTYTPGRPIARVELGQNQVVRQRLAPIIVTNYTLTIDPAGFSTYPSDYLQTDSIITNGFQRVRYVQQDSLYSYYNSAIDPVASNPIYLLENLGFRFYPVALGSATLSYVKNPPTINWAYATTNGRPVFTTGIQGVNVITGGSGYTSATVVFSAPGVGGVQATGTVSISGGVVTGIVMTNNGSGYMGLTPTMTFTGVGGVGATFSSPIISIDPVWDDASIFEIISRALMLIGVNLQSTAIEQFATEIKRNGQ